MPYLDLSPQRNANYERRAIDIEQELQTRLRQLPPEPPSKGYTDAHAHAHYEAATHRLKLQNEAYKDWIYDTLRAALHELIDEAFEKDLPTPEVRDYGVRWRRALLFEFRERLPSHPFCDHSEWVKSWESAIDQSALWGDLLYDLKSLAERQANKPASLNKVFPISAQTEKTVALPAPTPENIPAPSRYQTLLYEVLTRLKGNSGRVEDALSTFLESYAKGISRTQLTDYRAGRVKGKVSTEKCEAIENAITQAAKELGVTHSD